MTRTIDEHEMIIQYTKSPRVYHDEWGYEFAPLRESISFHPKHNTKGFISLVVIVAALVGFMVWGN